MKKNKNKSEMGGKNAKSQNEAVVQSEQKRSDSQLHDVFQLVRELTEF